MKRQVQFYAFLFICLVTGLAGAETSSQRSGLELNNGQKWVVDGAMMTRLRVMEQDLVTFQGKSQKDHQALAQQLKKNLDLLVSHCTMEGKAHDALHNWLVPYMSDVDAYAKAKDYPDQKAKCQALKESFTVFHAYFQ